MYKISIKQDFNRMAFAKWALHLKFRQVDSVPRALMMADDLLRGCTFDIYLSDEDKATGELVCTITEIAYEDPYLEDRKIQAEYFALRDRGAEGDAEAAIAYCKLEVQGLPNHAAMG